MSDTQPPTSTSGKETAPAPGVSRAPLAAVGLLLLASLPLEAYLLWLPLREIADFMPAEMIAEQLLASFKLYHSALLAALAAAIGGLLLPFQSRWGWSLATGAIAMGLLWTVELVVLALVSLAYAPEGMGAIMLEAFIDMLGLSHYIPVILFLVRAGSLTMLLLRKQRSSLSVEKRHRWVAFAIFAIFFIEANAVILIQFLGT